MRLISLLILLVVALLLARCSQPSGPAEESHEILLRVFIEADGTIKLDGEIGTLQQLKDRLTEVKSKDGAVLYSRANPEGDPPPNALEALQLIVDEELPVVLEPSGGA